jgi:hypothetical protein
MVVLCTFMEQSEWKGLVKVDSEETRKNHRGARGRQRTISSCEWCESTRNCKCSSSNSKLMGFGHLSITSGVTFLINKFMIEVRHYDLTEQNTEFRAVLSEYYNEREWPKIRLLPKVSIGYSWLSVIHIYTLPRKFNIHVSSALSDSFSVNTCCGNSKLLVL